jgi:hypothetical protein
MRLALANVVALVSLLLLAAGPRPAHAQFPSISAYPTCLSDSSYVVWSVFDPAPGHPEWVGFDVFKRVLPGCADYVRMNDQIIPRLPEPGYTIGLGEPASGKAVEYRVIPVDINRQQVFLPGFCSPCNAFANCPDLSSPITVGTLSELAPGFVYVIPCPGTCYPAPYFAGGVPAGLAPYVGTSTAFSLYGDVACGGVEGCSLTVDHWTLTSCVTPVVTRSWGQLKAIYR